MNNYNDLYIVMEKMPYNLKTLMTRNCEFKESHITTIMYNLLTGLKQMHEAGMVHRDIKPANLLVDENCQVKIADFGLSRSIPKK